jgi:hypothetical protein
MLALMRIVVSLCGSYLLQKTTNSQQMGMINQLLEGVCRYLISML